MALSCFTYAQIRRLGVGATAAYTWMPLLPDVWGTGTSPSEASRSAAIMAARATSTIVVPAPGSRSTTTRSASGSPRSSAPLAAVRWSSTPICHWGTCSSRAARLASQTRVAGSSATTYETGPSLVRIRAVRTHCGVPAGAFFS